MNPRKKNSSGFVLLFTLVAIALAGFVLAKLANHRLKLAMSSSEQIERLQRRWGSLTLRRCLAYSELEPEEMGRGYAIPMGNMVFDTRIDSEARKLNVNALLRKGGRENLLIAAGELLEANVPTYLTTGGEYESWGDVLDVGQLANGRQGAELLVRESQRITCWGNGRLHYQYAPDELFEILEPVLGFENVTKFLDLRSLTPEKPLKALLAELKQDASDGYLLESWLTDREDTRSIWMLVETKSTGRYLGAEFVVAHRTTNGATQMTTFQW